MEEKLMDDKDDDSYAEAQLKVCQAFLQFNSFFTEYVKELDPELWKKAIEYAKDSVDVPGVELRFVDEDDEDIFEEE
jgi:hypothetical protein